MVYKHSYKALLDTNLLLGAGFGYADADLIVARRYLTEVCYQVNTTCYIIHKGNLTDSHHQPINT